MNAYEAHRQYQSLRSKLHEEYAPNRFRCTYVSLAQVENAIRSLLAVLPAHTQRTEDQNHEIENAQTVLRLLQNTQ